MDTGKRPLDPVGSIKTKIGLLVALSILAAVLVLQAGTRAGVTAWLTLPVTIVVALVVTQWLARGMTAPLREMTSAARRMARGDHSIRVTATSADEVGELGRAFNTMAADLATADQQRRELVATVSHELRTPLTGQRALLENLVDGVVQPDDAALGAALAQSERLSSLVEDLLDVSRLDGGAVPLDIAPLDLRTLLQDAVAEAGIAGRPVRYEVDVEPPGLQVHADGARLQQVVANLLDNAARHSPADGLVRLEARGGSDHWWLEVTDQGPGIPEEKTESVFERFGAPDQATGGTGLGLAIARWVCELHGGSIAATPRSDGDSGAVIRVKLPLNPQGVATPPEPARSTMPAAPEPATPEAIPVDTALVPAAVQGTFWPERETLRTAPLAVLASVAIGLLAAIVLPERALGIGTFVVLLVAGALVSRLSIHRSRRWSMVAAAVSAGLGALVFLRASEWLAVLALMAVGVLVTTALTDARRPFGMVVGALSWSLSGIRGLPLLGRTLSAASKHSNVWPVVRTAAVSLVLLVVFVGLFASGDALFGSWVSRILPDMQIADTLVLRAFTWFMVGGVVLAGCYLALNPPQVNTVGPGQPKRVTRPWEWQVPVGVVLVVFAGFLAAQAAAMWGGHEYLARTTGLTYAQYVHQGFGQLVAATILTLVTIAATARRAPQETPHQRLVLRLMLGALCLLALVVVASALYRMGLYQEAYGYTVLRVLVDAFELWLGVVIVMVMVAGIRLSGRWLPRAAVISAAVFLLVIGLANPEAWVAQQNIQRYQSTGRLDLAYLRTLGADATPVITDGLPADLARCVLPLDSYRTDDALEWNLGRSRARTAIADAALPEVATNCPHTIGE